MALFCVVKDETHHRYQEWGFIKERMMTRAFVSFTPGSGEWFPVDDLDLKTWGETPDSVIDTFFHN